MENKLKTITGGKFIVFEGIDKTGKTTLIEKVYEYLKSEGYDVIKTREPGGVKISENIRSIILDRSNDEMDYKTEALLYAASRMQHLKEVVIPALDEDKIVLCDRYLLSSIAYQGYGRNLGEDYIKNIHDYPNIKMPDLNIILHCSQLDIFNILNRGRKEEDNRMDLQTVDFYKTVSQAYEDISKKIPNCKIIECFYNSRNTVFNITKHNILSIL